MKIFNVNLTHFIVFSYWDISQSALKMLYKIIISIHFRLSYFWLFHINSQFISKFYSIYLFSFLYMKIIIIIKSSHSVYYKWIKNKINKIKIIGFDDFRTKIYFIFHIEYLNI
jgi:hypothetical protein